MSAVLEGERAEPERLEPQGSLSVKDICQAMWAAERELDLLDWQVHGVHVWQALRFGIFLHLSRRAGVYDGSDQSKNLGISGSLRLGLNLLRGSLLHNPFAGSETFDALVFESARTTSVDGRRICIYTDDLVRELSAQGVRLQLVELADSGAHTKDRDARRVYLDFVELAGALRGQSRISLADRDVERLRALERIFQVRLATSLPLRKRFEAYVPNFRARHVLYRRLFAKRRPQKLYCVCSYGRLAPMIKAARDEGVQSIELQHGVVSRYHMGYSFPVRPKTGTLEYVPDLFYSWGNAWDEMMDLPFDPDRVKGHGFRHFERTRTRYANVTRDPRCVLVLSQPTVGPQLAALIRDNIDAFDGLEIVYKLHPQEYAAHKQYASLSRLSERPNVRVVTAVDIYELMARAQVQIGVCSTALYEGLQFGCKTVLVDLPGIEYMSKLIESGQTESFQAFVARLRACRAGGSTLEER